MCSADTERLSSFREKKSKKVLDKLENNPYFSMELAEVALTRFPERYVLV